jgi:transposase
MDERLPLGSVTASTLRMLLQQDRERRRGLEQEVARLQAGLARQNEVLIALQQRDAERECELAQMRTLVTALTEQNTIVRHRVAELEQERAQLRGQPLAPPPAPTPETKPATPPRQPTVRKQRAAAHNRGQRRVERATRWETHAADTCPGCGEQLAGGWIVRRVQMIDLPPRPSLEVTEHRILRRQCQRCGKRVLPAPVGLAAGRVGRCRFGPRLIAAIATMRTIERLPLAVIQERLEREHGLRISQGGIVGLLQRMAGAGRPAYEQLQADVRASPVVYADETGWREMGQQTTIWTVSTPALLYVHHGRRTNEEIDGILGADYGGTIVSDCYAAYDHFLGPKQRCWAHFVRAMRELLHAHGTNQEIVAWVEGVLELYAAARQPRPPQEEGTTPEAARARAKRAQRYEAMVLLLCPAAPDPQLPHATLAMRLRAHLDELFTFVRDPSVEDTNNRAERSLRPLVIMRKVTGGTRSATGSTTCMILYSVCATARIQGQDPTAVCQQLLLAPPGSPSPLAPPSPQA